MRWFMVDPDNSERLLKIPHRVVDDIKAEAFEEAREAVGGVRWVYPYPTGNSVGPVIDAALAAIDALKEDT